MTTTKTPTTAQRLADLRAEHEQLTVRLGELEQAAVDSAFLAEAGEPDARQRHAEVAAARSAAENRLRELTAAIASGERHLEREQREAAEAERQRWAKKADELRAAQLDAARRVDAALAELEAAHHAYLVAAGERGTAVRKSGGSWSNGAIATHLVRAVHALCPRLAIHLRLPREQRINATGLEKVVR